MPRYNVHLYPICRMTVHDIEAETPEDALRIANEQTDLYSQRTICGVEFADETDGAVVDLLNPDTGNPWWEQPSYSWSYDADSKFLSAEEGDVQP